MRDATPHFTDQNTQGYSAEALAELNRRFDAAVAAGGRLNDTCAVCGVSVYGAARRELNEKQV